MKDLFDCLITNNGMAFGTGVIIFLITLILTATRVIGFSVAVLLLLVALGASFGVANQEAIRGYFQKGGQGKSAESTYKANSTPTSSSSEEKPLMEQLEKTYENLKQEFGTYKKKVQDYLEKEDTDKDQQQQQQQQQQK